MNQDRSWLTDLLLGDEQLVSRLADIDAGGGLDDDGRLALRLFLDARIREIAGWPREQDYQAIAEELDRAGHLDLSSAMQNIAGTSVLIGEAHVQRACRYAARGDSARQARLRGLESRHVIDYSDDAPVAGIDGATYAAGYIHDGPDVGFVVVVRSDGMAELIGFSDYERQRRWIADRGPTATGALDMPSAVPEPRVVLEERILAALLADPCGLTLLMAHLPPGTFTATARYEIYSAMLTVAAGHGRWYASDVAAELGGRTARMPGESLREARGYGASWMLKYLQRLDQTSVSAADAAAAFRAVIAEDLTARQSTAQAQAFRDRIGQVAVARPERMPEVEHWLSRSAGQRGSPHDVLPPTESSGQARPVPRP